MFLGSAPSSLVLDAVERGHLPQWRTPRSAVGAPSCAALRFTRAHLGVGHVEPEDIKVFLGILVDLGRIGASAKRHGAATLPVADGCQERQPRTPHRKLQKTAARAAQHACRVCAAGTWRVQTAQIWAAEALYLVARAVTLGFVKAQSRMTWQQMARASAARGGVGSTDGQLVLHSQAPRRRCT